MDASQLNVFVDGATRYFHETTGVPAEVGSPYLIDDAHSVAGEFTGAIGVSGRHRGNVYFTADRALLTVLMGTLGETEQTRENMLDLVGDIANTISGNARQRFGPSFLISVPTLIFGRNALALPRGVKSYAIPVVWQRYRSTVIVVLDSPAT